MTVRRLVEVERDVASSIRDSTQRFLSEFEEQGDVWVVKFIDARFLGAFLSGGSKSLTVSATPGFTWGDAIYVTPLRYPYSTMMYGRAGIVGSIPASQIRAAYDAAARVGVALYQEWIQHSTHMFRLLTTTLHANVANRFLRNAFRARFGIDLVWFPPDQFNPSYVNKNRDRWFAVSDWTHSGVQLPGQAPKRSAVIRDCEWVAIVGEQFEEAPLKVYFNELFGPYLQRPIRAGRSSPSTLVTDLKNAHADARNGTQTIVYVDP